MEEEGVCDDVVDDDVCEVEGVSPLAMEERDMTLMEGLICKFKKAIKIK